MTLSPSDWLQIVLSLVGFLVGAMLSWVFYRAQQNTDFNKLRDGINELGKHIGLLSDSVKLTSDQTNRTQTSYDNRLTRLERNLQELTKLLTELNKSQDFTQKIENTKDIAALKATIESLNRTINGAVESIISEVRGQQRILSQSIQGKFQDQSKQALDVISQHLRHEIGAYFQSDKALSIVIEKVNSTVEQAINKMGEYQRLNIEEVNEKALSTVKHTAGIQVQTLQGKVEEIEQKLNLLSLPPPQ